MRSRIPSEPNYLALLSGSTQGLRDDSCPHRYSASSLVGQLRAAGLTFAGYAEGLPHTGYSGCADGRYVRRHAPWTNFTDAPAALSRPFTAHATRLRTIADGVVRDPRSRSRHARRHGRPGRHVAASNLSGYARWATSHNSVLIVTWDEDDHSANNHIPTIITGAVVRAGRNGVRGDLYRLLRTLEWFYGLSPLGAAAQHTPITTVWTA